MNKNSYAALIIGAGIAAVVTVLVTNFLNTPPTGSREPSRVRFRSYTARTADGEVDIANPPLLSPGASPVAQNTPITEAAYSVHMTSYAPTLGPEENSAANPITLPA